MHVDPIIPPLTSALTIVLAVGLALQWFRQPQLIGYLAAGALIGPHGLGIVSDQTLVEHLGALGVTLLMFFIGMEVSPRRLVRGWRVAIIGTAVQVFGSVVCLWLIGASLGWPLARIVLLGFVISLSSTAVVLKLLQDRGELGTKAGENVLLILLAQDLAVIPMLVGISFLSGERPEPLLVIKQVVGGAAVVAGAGFLLMRSDVRFPFSERIRQDHELQVFAALLVCFGFAAVTAYLGLSAALGSLIAGMLVSAARETEWIHRSLEPLKIVLVAVFFISIGMLIDPGFIMPNWPQILALVVGVLLTNTFINALTLRVLGDDWSTSLYSGALLAQIGEFSFVLATVGLQAGIIGGFSHQMTVVVIALTLILSPAWIAAAKRLFVREADRRTECG
jgi:CPA2 family monovalent cation:H+ antiporter-2